MVRGPTSGIGLKSLGGSPRCTKLNWNPASVGFTLSADLIIQDWIYRAEESPAGLAWASYHRKQERAMRSECVEHRNGAYYVAGTRISLDSVVYAFLRGDSPQRILERYPLLGELARVYGAIAYYLDHKAQIDIYLEEARREFQAAEGPPLSEANPALWERLERARNRIKSADPE